MIIQSNEFESDEQVRKDELIQQEIEHIQVNSSEIDSLIVLISDDIARLYCLHQDNLAEFGRLVAQMIDGEIRKEGTYRGEGRAEK